MSKKKMIIPLFLLLAMTGLTVAGSVTGWFKSPAGPTHDLPALKDEYLKLYERYTSRDSAMQVAGTITLYDGENKGVVKEKTAFRFIKQAGEFYSQFGYLQTFYDGRVLVQLDTMNKVIVVAKEHKAILPQAASFDVLFSDTAAFRVSGSVAQNKYDERTISFQSDLNPEVKKYSITYNPGTYQVKQATIEWWKDGMAPDATGLNRVWISQIDYQHVPAGYIRVSDLIGNIITIKKNRIEPALAYRQYQMQVTNSEQ